jgi:hypothetical protein
MMRESLAADSRHVILDIEPTGTVEFMTRQDAGGNTRWIAGSSHLFPAWLRLTRSGSTIEGSISDDGMTWWTLGSTTFAATGPIFVGLPVTAHNAALVNTSTFDNVAVTGGGSAPKR